MTDADLARRVAVLETVAEKAAEYRAAEESEADSICAHYAARDTGDGEAEERALDAAKDAMRVLDDSRDALDAALSAAGAATDQGDGET